ncbi:hypothetical protein [Acinetobacter ursingii]|uniref:hypothetical protein n=1 Tax=Acinetobacter ursingii TaxID=108980 RepID=UPI0021CD69A5|nr:hypothetical protein [Acinetobacter ursingii]MCU4481342.1 hypothetical protein [Acinetobacter ursingii]MCU4505674.1 hypothetical protein [Acinetobacter ursingii]MCU4569620.1 hypothetical protein [Acinetobacter ursingii]
MNFSFKFDSKKQKDSMSESAKVLFEAVESYQKAIQDGVAQYNETRRKAEEQINRGGKITRHRIDL